MRYRLLLVLFSIALAALPCFGQEEDADDFSDMRAAAESAATSVSESGGAETGGGLEWGGDFTLSLPFPLYFDPWRYASSASAPRAEIRFALGYSRDRVRFGSEWYGSASPEAGRTLPASAQWRPGVQELTYTGKSLSLSTGLLEINWGSADGVNPTDVLNPRDYRALPRPEKLPVPALQLRWFPSQRVALEGVYIPYRGADELPFDAEATLREVPIISSVSAQHPEFSPSSGVPAARISLFLENLDLSLMYGYSFDPYDTPRFHSYAPAPSASCELSSARVHTTGFGIRGAAGRFGYWLEGAYSHPEGFQPGDYSHRSPVVEVVGGFDARFGRDGAWYTNLQLRGRYLPWFDEDYYTDYPGGSFDLAKVAEETYMLDYYRRSFLYSLSEYRERVLTGLLFRLAWEKGMELSLDGAWLVPFGYGDTGDDFRSSFLLNPEISWPLSGGFEIACGAVLNGAWSLAGGELVLNDQDPLGARRPENHLYLETSFAW